jgi:hypothetical protein
MKTETADLLLEITDRERHRIVEALDRPQDRYLVEELLALEPARGLVIKAPNADTARALKIVSTQGGNAFPVYCTYGEGAQNRTRLEVSIAPERVAEIARAVQRDSALHSLIEALRQTADDLQTGMAMGNDETIPSIVEAHIEYCLSALRALNVNPKAAATNKEGSSSPTASERVDVDGLLFA